MIYKACELQDKTTLLLDIEHKTGLKNNIIYFQKNVSLTSLSSNSFFSPLIILKLIIKYLAVYFQALTMSYTLIIVRKDKGKIYIIKIHICPQQVNLITKLCMRLWIVFNQV